MTKPKYTTQARELRRLLLDHLAKDETPGASLSLPLAKAAKLLGVNSPTTVQKWLSGESCPRRTQAIEAARRLKLEDDFTIAAWYGYDPLSDETPATLAELEDFVERCDCIEQKEAVLSRLRMAADLGTAYERETVTYFLARPWPLRDRALHIARFADMAASHPLLQVA